MADISFLAWPFFDDHHRDLARDLETWCVAEGLAGERHDGNVDAACIDLAMRLGGGLAALLRPGRVRRRP